MKKTLPLFISLCCVGANATSVNYDLLGRKSSKMNSPMVYKNVDYSKVESKEEQSIGSSLENRVLAKTGMPDNVKAIQGIFHTYGTTTQSVNDGHFILKKYSSNGNESSDTYSWSGYRNALNKIFKKTNEDYNTNPNYETAAESNSDKAGYSYYDLIVINDNLLQPSPYPVQNGQNIKYTSFFNVVRENSEAGYVYNWYPSKQSDVGIYMDAGALPADIKPKSNVKYVRTSNESAFNPTPGLEMEATRTYKILAKTTENYKSVIYVGKGDLDSPDSKQPQVYIGVRNKHESASLSYGSVAKKLDNYIYANRTIEFVAAGDYGAHVANAKPKMNASAFAANAITVGAYDPISESVLSYTSTAKNKGVQYQPYYNGSIKPEVYNYSNLATWDYKRTYTSKSSGTTYEYRALYDGTRIAAAYTAGMVANLLAANPFYRWHPEVVKAFLLTQDRDTPSYRYLVFDEDEQLHYDYYSRYWNGDLNSFITRTYNNRPEIWFVVHGLDGNPSKYTYAAISWLSSGNDISKFGHIPQNFDMYAYGSNNADLNCFEGGRDLNKPVKCNNKTLYFDFDHPGTPIGSSTSEYNSYEKIKLPSTYNHYVFKIVLKNEESSSENKGQVVMGFNLSNAK